MENLRPQVDRIELNGRSFVFKCYLKMKAFSYRCVNHYTHSCKFLLTIPLTAGNYDPETWKFISANGAFQASKEGHSIACSNYSKENMDSIPTSIQESLNNSQYKNKRQPIQIISPQLKNQKSNLTEGEMESENEVPFEFQEDGEENNSYLYEDEEQEDVNQEQANEYDSEDLFI